MGGAQQKKKKVKNKNKRKQQTRGRDEPGPGLRRLLTDLVENAGKLAVHCSLQLGDKLSVSSDGKIVFPEGEEFFAVMVLMRLASEFPERVFLLDSTGGAAASRLCAEVGGWIWLQAHSQALGIPDPPDGATFDHKDEEWQLRYGLTTLARAGNGFARMESVAALVDKSFAFTSRKTAVASVRMLLSESSETLSSSTYTCCVCFEEIKVFEYVWNCRHTVCSTCARQMNACPICRTTDVSLKGVKVEVTHEMAMMAQRLSVLSHLRVVRTLLRRAMRSYDAYLRLRVNMLTVTEVEVD